MPFKLPIPRISSLQSSCVISKADNNALRHGQRFARPDAPKLRSNPLCRRCLHTRARHHATSDAPVNILPDMPSPRTTGPQTSADASTGSMQQYTPNSQAASQTEDMRNDPSWPRRPRALQAIYLRPLKRKAEYRVPACDLQLRSYSVRNLEFFADFALRAAYFLGLPASGPVPLPRIVERWTVPRSSFIYKKSQENFERITMRRLIQIQDANTSIVETWLAFLQKHAYYGVGMKANVWQYEKLGVGKTMDAELESLKTSLEPSLAQVGRRTLETSQKVSEMMGTERYKTPPESPQEIRLKVDD